jgi:phage major head subunit gpT-like protein
MDINATNISALNRQSAIIFDRGSASYQPQRSPFCARATTKVGLVVVGWLGLLPSMQPFVKELERQNVGSSTWQIATAPYAAGWEIPRLDVLRDTFGIYAPVFESGGQLASFHPDMLFFDRIVAGFASVDYTGKNFFDADKNHVKGVTKGKFTNRMTKQLTDVHFGTARRMLNEIRLPNGVPFNLVRDLTLICGETWRAAAEALLETKTLPGGGDNPNYGKAKLLVTPLISDSKWFLVNGGMPFKPLVEVEEIKTEFSAQTDPNSDSVFNREAFAYKAYGVYSLDYGLPQTIIGSTGADA